MGKIIVDENFIVTVNKEEVQFVQCCDCGLVHEVYYDIYQNSIDMVFTRDEGRTITRRAEMKGVVVSKVKSISEQLDEDTLRHPLNPPDTEKVNCDNYSSIGEIFTNGVLKNVGPEQNADSRKKSPY